MTGARSFILVAAVAVLSLLIYAGHAFAGAWTQSHGHGQVIAGATIARASDQFDETGTKADAPRFRKDDYDVYGEYGWSDRLTLILHSRYTVLHPDAPSARASGLSEAEFGLRQRLYSGMRGAASVQATLFAPGNTVLTSGGVDGEIRFGFGSNFRVWRFTGFLDSAIAYRRRANNFSDELRGDLTAGVNLTRSAQLLIQSFNIVTIGSGRTNSFSGQLSKAQLSVVYQLAPRWSLQLGGLATISGTQVPRERGLVSALWYRF